MVEVDMQTNEYDEYKLACELLKKTASYLNAKNDDLLKKTPHDAKEYDAFMRNYLLFEYLRNKVNKYKKDTDDSILLSYLKPKQLEKYKANVDKAKTQIQTKPLTQMFNNKPFLDIVQNSQELLKKANGQPNDDSIKGWNEILLAYAPNDLKKKIFYAMLEHNLAGAITQTNIEFKIRALDGINSLIKANENLPPSAEIQQKIADLKLGVIKDAQKKIDEINNSAMDADDKFKNIYSLLYGRAGSDYAGIKNPEVREALEKYSKMSELLPAMASNLLTEAKSKYNDISFISSFNYLNEREALYKGSNYLTTEINKHKSEIITSFKSELEVVLKGTDIVSKLKFINDELQGDVGVGNQSVNGVLKSFATELCSGMPDSTATFSKEINAIVANQSINDFEKMQNIDYMLQLIGEHVTNPIKLEATTVQEEKAKILAAASKSVSDAKMKLVENALANVENVIASKSPFEQLKVLNYLANSAKEFGIYDKYANQLNLLSADILPKIAESLHQNAISELSKIKLTDVKNTKSNVFDSYATYHSKISDTFVKFILSANNKNDSCSRIEQALLIAKNLLDKGNVDMFMAVIEAFANSEIASLKLIPNQLSESAKQHYAIYEQMMVLANNRANLATAERIVQTQQNSEFIPYVGSISNRMTFIFEISDPSEKAKQFERLKDQFMKSQDKLQNKQNIQPFEIDIFSGQQKAISQAKLINSDKNSSPSTLIKVNYQSDKGMTKLIADGFEESLNKQEKTQARTQTISNPDLSKTQSVPIQKNVRSTTTSKSEIKQTVSPKSEIQSTISKPKELTLEDAKKQATESISTYLNRISGTTDVEEKKFARWAMTTVTQQKSLLATVSNPNASIYLSLRDGIKFSSEGIKRDLSSGTYKFNNQENDLKLLLDRNQQSLEIADKERVKAIIQWVKDPNNKTSENESLINEKIREANIIIADMAEPNKSLFEVQLSIINLSQQSEVNNSESLDSPTSSERRSTDLSEQNISEVEINPVSVGPREQLKTENAYDDMLPRTINDSAYHQMPPPKQLNTAFTQTSQPTQKDNLSKTQTTVITGQQNTSTSKDTLGDRQSSGVTISSQKETKKKEQSTGLFSAIARGLEKMVEAFSTEKDKKSTTAKAMEKFSKSSGQSIAREDKTKKKDKMNDEEQLNVKTSRIQTEKNESVSIRASKFGQSTSSNKQTTTVNSRNTFRSS